MNTKFIITSVFAFISASVVQAADVVVPKQPANVVSSVIVSPSFSWAGVYLGGQVGGFSSETSAMIPDADIPLFPDRGNKNKKWVPVEKKYMPKLSGAIGGFYAGANIALGKSFILGVDTDILFLERKDTKTIVNTNPEESDEAGSVRVVEVGGRISERQVRGKPVIGGVGKVLRPAILKEKEAEAEEDSITFIHMLKQKWTGATRMRIGFSADRIMPYISGGIAYGQFQDVLSISVTGEDGFKATSDAKETMVGYTLGGGVDFAMTDNIIVRAEYRYSDFGKKKFKDEIEINYKTNDFRAGIAYKF
ncbi:outer membrane protein [Bartonella sp. B12(2025)]